jgi:hypothetical protein
MQRAEIQSPSCRRQEQQNRHRVEQDRYDQDEIPEHVLVAGAEQGRQIADRPEIGFHLAPLAINGRLLDLQGGERLGLVGALGNQVGPSLTLLIGEAE